MNFFERVSFCCPGSRVLDLLTSVHSERRVVEVDVLLERRHGRDVADLVHDRVALGVAVHRRAERVQELLQWEIAALSVRVCVCGHARGCRDVSVHLKAICRTFCLAYFHKQNCFCWGGGRGFLKANPPFAGALLLCLTLRRVGPLAS